MQIVKRLGIVLIAVWALVALAASSANASPTFLTHPIGRLLLALADNIQVFSTPGGALSIECKELKLLPPDKGPGALQFLAFLVAVDYEKCTAIGLSATIHPVLYQIDANGLVTLDNTVLILIPSAACTITLPAGKNQSLNTVKFDNQKDGSLLVLAKITKITSFGVGAGCTYAEESNGTYEGNVRVTTEGGVVRWDP